MLPRQSSSNRACTRTALSSRVPDSKRKGNWRDATSASIKSNSSRHAHRELSAWSQSDSHADLAICIGFYVGSGSMSCWTFHALPCVLVH